jgi:hypothetical protein
MVTLSLFRLEIQREDDSIPLQIKKTGRNKMHAK